MIGGVWGRLVSMGGTYVVRMWVTCVCVVWGRWDVCVHVYVRGHPGVGVGVSSDAGGRFGGCTSWWAVWWVYMMRVCDGDTHKGWRLFLRCMRS